MIKEHQNLYFCNQRSPTQTGYLSMAICWGALDLALYKKGKKLSWELLTPITELREDRGLMLTLGSLSLGSTDHVSLQCFPLYLHWAIAFLLLDPYHLQRILSLYALSQCSLEIQPFSVTKENLILIKTCQNTGYWLGLLSASLLMVWCFSKASLLFFLLWYPILCILSFACYIMRKRIINTFYF